MAQGPSSLPCCLALSLATSESLKALPYSGHQQLPHAPGPAAPFCEEWALDLSHQGPKGACRAPLLMLATSLSFPRLPALSLINPTGLRTLGTPSPCGFCCPCPNPWRDGAGRHTD